MTDKPRLLYYFLLGAFGGATGWILNAILFHGSTNSLALKALIVSGAIIGGAIGFALALYEWLSTGSWVRLITFGLKGLLIGILAGGFALPLTQWIYGALLNSSSGATGESSVKRFLAGFVCWLVFGSIIGSIEGFYKGTQMWKGWLGGLAGAFISGTLYELNRPPSAAMDNITSLIWQAVGLAFIGGFIGLAIALISTVMRKAWVVIVDGKAKDKEIDVTKYVDRVMGKRKHGIIGSDQYAANIFLPADTKALPKHATLSYTDEAPTLTATEEAVKLKAITTVGGRSITKCPLVDGDRIKIGQTTLIYHQK